MMLLLIIFGGLGIAVTLFLVLGAVAAPDLSCPNCRTTHLSRGKVCPDCGAEMPELAKPKTGELTGKFGIKEALLTLVAIGFIAWICSAML